MKAKKIAKKTKMTDAEIQEAIRRDKEWMGDIDSDEGIVFTEGELKELKKDIFGDEGDEKREEEDASNDIDIDDEFSESLLSFDDWPEDARIPPRSRLGENQSGG